MAEPRSLVLALAAVLALVLVPTPPPAGAAAAPVLVRGPWVSGPAEAGATLTAQPGTWSPAGVSLSFQWLADGRPVAGATTRSYTIPAFESGTRYTFRVTATARGESTTARAKPTRATVATPGTAPFGNRLMPAVLGRPAEGERLEADPGEWSSPPTTYRYRWLADGQEIAGASARTFTPTAAQVGQAISVEVTARSDDGSLRRTTPETDPVAPAPGPDTPVAVEGGPRLAGAPLVGREVRVDTGSTDPAGAGTSVQWLLDGRPLAGADTATYTPAASDLGGRLSARVTYDHPDRASLTRTSAAVLVRAPATVRVRAVRAAAREARLVVRVTAPGIHPVPGRVLVRDAHGERLAGRRLDDGRAVLSVRPLRPGAHTLRVVHPGSTLVARHVRSVRVVVRR